MTAKVKISGKKSPEKERFFPPAVAKPPPGGMEEEAPGLEKPGAFWSEKRLLCPKNKFKAITFYQYMSLSLQ